MNLQPFSIAGVAVVLYASIVAAEQYEAPPEADAENLDTPTPDQSPAAPSRPAKASSSADAERKASLPHTPYPAGLSWVLTPQPFRVPIPNRIFYYPPHTYVRRCPYYPRGYYWGANWRFNVIGRGNRLFMGTFRFNPYLTAAKAEHHERTRGQRRYVPPPGPVGQAELLGSSGSGAPVALPPTSAPEPDVRRSAESGNRAKTSSSKGATVRRASPRAPARTASTRHRAKSGTPGRVHD